MDTSTASSYRGYLFPVEIISQCIWFYFRFCLSFRDVQEMMLEHFKMRTSFVPLYVGTL